MNIDLKTEYKLKIIRRIPRVVSEVLSAFRENAFLAGGSIRSILGDTQVKDWDIFVRKEYRAEIAESLEKENFFQPKARTISTDSADTIVMPLCEPIQIIHGFSFSGADDLISQFDFSVNAATLYCDLSGKYQFVFNYSFLHDTFHRVMRWIVSSENEDKESLDGLQKSLRLAREGFRVPRDSLVRMLIGGLKNAGVILSIDQMNIISEKIDQGGAYEIQDATESPKKE